MSDRIAPGPEAKARIQNLGHEKLQGFFDEIPASAMQTVARFLPGVDGFRKTSQAGIIRQKQALAQRLTRSSGQERDYYALYMIWRTWIDEHIQDPLLVQELVDDVEEAADRAEGQETRRAAIEEHVDLLLEKLKQESQQNKCTREQIDQLFTFSPFPETAATRALISSAKSAAEVQRDAALSEVPTRLKQSEDQI